MQDLNRRFLLKQQLRTGVIEKTPLSDLVYEAPNVKEYVIEKGRRDASRQAVSDARVYAADTVAPACDGILDFNEKGEVVYKTCLAPGTLVHTDQGLVPVEKIRVGTRVLSQPEQGGEQDYRSVINTVAHLDQPIYAVQVEVDGADELSTLFATGNHPFWVEDVLVEGEHWLAAECLAPGHVLQMADGRKASVHASALVRRTQHVQIGFAADDRAGVGIVLDLSERQIKLADSALTRNLGQLELGEAYLSPVYNFEVEEFHTYYVGEAAVWVHNTNCDKTEAVRSAFDKVEIENACFDYDVYVIVRDVAVKTGELVQCYRKIGWIEVGDEVLSRSEITGEIGYRKVLKVFQHDAVEAFDIHFDIIPPYAASRGKPEPITATAEHPFWVIGRGWTEVRSLQPGDEFLTCDSVRAYVEEIRKCPYRVEPYNLEVDEFHTYFVGAEGLWVHNTKDARQRVEVQVLNS